MQMPSELWGWLTAGAAVMLSSGVIHLGSWVGETGRDRDEQLEKTQMEIEATDN